MRGALSRTSPLWAAGMSFGSWIALTVGADDPRVSALIGIALPLSRYDFAAVRDSPKPKFFIHGERDEICPLKDDARVLRAAPPSRRSWSSSTRADHLFDGKVSEVARRDRGSARRIGRSD